METSLYFKTALILSIQLGIVFLGCFYFIRTARKHCLEDRPFFGLRFEAKKNSRGELDLVPIVPEPVITASPVVRERLANASPSVKAMIRDNPASLPQQSGPMSQLILIWMFSLFGMTFLAPLNTTIGITLMTISSIAFAPLLGLIMLEADENDGLRTILVTVFITVAAALVGMYSGIDFSPMREFLFYGLCGLILFGLIRLLFGMNGALVRFKAILGAILFSLFLIYDFNRLKQLNDLGTNDWATALQIAISLYLDIINLLLELMEAME